MFDGRVPDPITRVGPSRDRPFEVTHFERVEAARDAGDRGTRGRQRPPAGQPLPPPQRQRPNRPRPTIPPQPAASERTWTCAPEPRGITAGPRR